MQKLPMKIVGAGHYIPDRVMSNAQIERIAGLPSGSVERTHAGVKERRWVTHETGSYMNAMACREAVADAGLELSDIDLIINGSGTQEQAIPDGGPLIQRQLGLGGTGVAAISIHSTCLSFLVGLNVAANFLNSGQYRNILVTAGDIGSAAINPKDAESFVLFGDIAAAVVVTRAEEGESSGVTGYVFRTFGEGAYLTQVPGGGTRRHPNFPETTPEDNLFQMDGKRVYMMALEQGPPILEELRPGLSRSLGDIKAVVSHQASGLALDALPKLGWPADRIVRTIHKYGNCIGASIPITLYETIKEGRIERGDEVLFLGTGAGLSIGAMIITY